jgi:hypothetical protein
MTEKYRPSNGTMVERVARQVIYTIGEEWMPTSTAPEKIRIRALCIDENHTDSGGRGIAFRVRTLIRFGDRWWYPNRGFYIKRSPVLWKQIGAKREPILTLLAKLDGQS